MTPRASRILDNVAVTVFVVMSPLGAALYYLVHWIVTGVWP